MNTTTDQAQGITRLSHDRMQSVDIVKPVAGIAALFPFMALAGKIKGPAASGMAHVGRTTLFLYCFDFFATPIAVRYFTPTGILPTLAIAISVVALGIFINLAWEYAILPELKKTSAP